jgi:hypothetical protein
MRPETLNDNEFECTRCGTIATIGMKECPNCGLDFFPEGGFDFSREDEQDEDKIITSNNSFSKEDLPSLLKECGWKDIHSGKYSRVEYDLIGFRSIGLTGMHIFVKHIPLLDAKAAMVWQARFGILYKTCKPGFLKSEAFAVCLLIEEVLPEGLNPLQNNLGDARRMLIISDLENNLLYGNFSASLVFPIFNNAKKDLEIIFAGSD